MRAILGLSVIALTACATDPSDIKPVPVDYRIYLSNDCATLGGLVQTKQAELNDSLSSQGHARVGDALLWPLPASRMLGVNGRNVRNISRLSGEVDALKQAQTLRCAEVKPS